LHSHIREQEGAARKYKLNAQHEVTLTVHIPARGYTWLVVE